MMINFIAFPLYMGFVSRMAGGGHPKLPWGLDAWILSLPYLLLWFHIGWWVIPAYLCAVLGIRSGHGSGFYYWEKFKKTRTVEKIELIISGALSYHAQKVLIMVLTGLWVTLVASIALACHGYIWQSAVLALSGALKGVAYALPRTELAEMARGAFLGLGLAVVL